jgi:DNA-binding LacI/PurR family transcriptional regulator
VNRPSATRPDHAKKPVTLQEVADAARVSPTTASQALNNKGRVNQKTRERIVRIAANLGYVANPRARSLKTGRAMILLTELPGVRGDAGIYSGFIGELLIGAADAAMASGYLMMIGGPDVGHSPNLICDGAVLVDPYAEDPLFELAPAVVTVGRMVDADDEWPWVDNDHHAAVHLTLDHLQDEGFRRPALLTASGSFSFAENSVGAYEEWMTARGRQGIVEKVAPHPDLDQGRIAVAELFDRRDPPDALLTSSEPLALAALEVIERRGMSVPGDVGLVNLYDSETLRTARIPITAVDLKPREVGHRAVQILIQQIGEDGMSARSSLVGATLIHRASTSRRA